jgi:hypothetical protein
MNLVISVELKVTCTDLEPSGDTRRSFSVPAEGACLVKLPTAHRAIRETRASAVTVVSSACALSRLATGPSSIDCHNAHRARSSHVKHAGCSSVSGMPPTQCRKLARPAAHLTCSGRAITPTRSSWTPSTSRPRTRTAARVHCLPQRHRSRTARGRRQNASRAQEALRLFGTSAAGLATNEARTKIAFVPRRSEAGP